MHRHAATRDDELGRRLKREALQRGADRPELGRVGIAHGSRDQLGERRAERRHGSRGAGGKPLRDQCLRADEDVQAFEQIRSESLPGGVRHLQAAEVGRCRPQLLEHRERDRVAAPSRELVDVERRRPARPRRGSEVREQLRLVEREVRRGHHRDGVGADVGCVRRKLDRVPGRLRAAVHRHLEPAVGGLDEELRRAQPLLDWKQEALAGRAEREQPVDPAGVQEVDVWRDRSLVERLARVLERRQRRRECASQHGPTLS